MINNLHIVPVSNNPSNMELKILLKCNNELAKTSNDELFTFKQFKSDFNNNSILCHWYIFYLNNIAIGGAMIMDPDENCQAFSIGNIIIYPEFRHFGYGRQCLSLLINTIKQINSILPIYLGVETSNIIAIHLYQEFGFKIIKKFIENNKEFYQMCLGKPLITEEINNLVKNNIQNNLVYHSSPFRLPVLLGTKTGKWSGETGNVFVTPCKGIAACFIINKTQILDKLKEKCQIEVINGLNFGYDIWNKPIEELYEIPQNIIILLNLPNFKSFSGTSIGYLYTINFNQYKEHCHMFNKNPNSDVEFLIEGDVEYLKCEKISVNWTCISSEEEIKKHGLAIFKEVYDAPYTFEQMKENGYSDKIIAKLMADPAHNWRATTGLELIHKEPSLEEQKRTWNNWNLMTQEQKNISDKKSIELFGLTNVENYQKIMNEYWNTPITEEILKTDDDIPFIYPQPNLDDQRALWKKWQSLTKKQKAISDKKSLGFFNMTNKDHNDFIFREYWNAPIIAESKFDKIFKQVLTECYDINQIKLIDLNKDNQDELDLFLNAINMVAEISHNDKWTLDELLDKYINQLNKKWLFFELNGKKIGTICYRLFKDFVVISCFSIFPEFQGLGFGRKSFEIILNLLKELFNDKTIQLRCYEKNIPALTLYKSCGFTEFDKQNETLILNLDSIN